MRHNATFVRRAVPVFTVTIFTMVAGCVPVDAQRSDPLVPSIDQLRAQAAEQQAANRGFVEQLDATLHSEAEQDTGSDLERRLTSSLERALSGTGANLRRVDCGGSLCKVEITDVVVGEMEAVLAALAAAQTCELPVIDLPGAAAERTLSAFIKCKAA